MKINFKHLCQEFDRKVLDLAEQKRFYPYEYTFSFEKFNKTLPGKNEFFSSLSDQGISDKEYQHVIKV